MRISNPNLQKLSHIWITDSFVYPASLRIGKFIPLYCHYIMKKLELCQYIIWGEFEILTNSGTVEELKIKGVFRNDGFVGIEDIVAQVPNATSIEISDSIFTPTTCASLASLKHTAKISNLILQNINKAEFLKLNFLILFIIKNVSSGSKVRVDFKLYEGDHVLIQEMNGNLKLMEAINNNYIAGVLKRWDLQKSAFLRCLMH
uniref:Receptor L-domain domain-containing protein n=1 Tax=Panagrolaimus sp. ES5 TaxID=591445 RepID=A0AC34FAP9_9BILA